MPRIGDVWDSTTAVLAGRAGLLTPIALAAFVLPSAVQSAVRLFGGPSPGSAALSALVGLGALVANLWGQLADIAVASDPETIRAEAGSAALARLPKALLVVLVLAAGAVLLAVPTVLALVLTGYDLTAAAAYRGVGPMPPVAPAAASFVLLYGIALVVGLIWLSARLFLTNAVILNERRGIGALGRSMALTRGLTWKLIGVALLFGIVFLVALLAVQSVVGLVFRLMLGADNRATALFLAAVAGALLTAAFTTVVQVFAARLYAAVTGEGARAGA